jgi:septal ring factor EnvC (AmiA/AmiB activator)
MNSKDFYKASKGFDKMLKDTDTMLKEIDTMSKEIDTMSKEIDKHLAALAFRKKSEEMQSNFYIYLFYRIEKSSFNGY